MNFWQFLVAILAFGVIAILGLLAFIGFILNLIMHTDPTEEIETNE